MKRLHLYLSLFWIAAICTSISCFAEYAYDCGIVANGVALAEKGLQGYASNSVLDKQALHMSLTHLKNYCCKIWFIKDTNVVCKDAATAWEESPLLFDHLIDSSYRKLDAYMDASLRYWLAADVQWVARQKKIEQFLNTSISSTPEQLITSFTTARQLKSENTLASDNNCQVSTFSWLSLYQKYDAACHIAVCISQKTNNISSLSNGYTSAQKTNDDMCSSLAKNRYTKEATYVKQLVARISIRSITSAMQAYIQNYFVDIRRQYLYDQWQVFDQSLTFVNRKVQEGTPACESR